MKNKRFDVSNISLRANRADVLGRSVERIVERLEQRILLVRRQRRPRLLRRRGLAPVRLDRLRHRRAPPVVQEQAR